MNSYSENLQTSVATSLQALQLEQKSTESTRDAAAFSLYYAEAAQITSAENLAAANVKYQAQQAIKEQAVNSNNVAVNLLNSANQQKSYTNQSVTNNAVNASNVQIASNAIIRLAGDMGSIFSILKAADFDSEIYNQGKTAYELMSETAYDAERLSQNSMEASGLTAYISAPAVADEIKVASSAMASLLGVVSADYDSIAAVVTGDNAAFATASAAEKQAEGTLEFVNAEFYATNSAYELNNKELNLHLGAKRLTDDSYRVSFTHYKSPFAQQSLTKAKPGHSQKPAAHYPVKNYYIMLVKESKRALFTLANAQALLLYPQQYVQIPMESETVAQHTKHKREQELSRDIIIDELQDSDGDKMDLGVNYVVFVMAELMDEYKKAINDFDDYLSAPSASFTLTTQLKAPASKDIKFVKNIVSFPVKEDKDPVKLEVEYRGIFLPANSNLVSGLLTAESLRSLEKDLEKLQKIADQYEPEIFKLEGELQTLQATLNGLDEQKKEATTKGAEETATDTTDLDKSMGDVLKQIKANSDALKKTKAEMNAAIKVLTPTVESQPGFYFDIKIAEQLPAANYTVAKPNKDTKAFDVAINDSTTDNFGNRLVAGNSYVPVVLVVSAAPEEDQAQYTSDISDKNSTLPFTYPNNQK
jgi:hypothetical protein